MQIQVKIIIGTIAFMLTMILLAFVALREPERLREYSAAETARQIENGAALYEENCVECHGINGLGTNGGECFETDGDPVACVGRPLNAQELVCGNRPARLEQQAWLGSKYDYINGTLQAGRPWANMPTWGQDFGGPLAYNQIDALTLFILNWENDELCGAPPPPTTVWPASVVDLPVGDLANGEELYVSQACIGCHGDMADEASSGTFPWLGDLAQVGGERIEGYSAADYTYESILLPQEHISPNWASCEGISDEECQGLITAMPNNYFSQLDEQQMADLIAFLLGTTEFESDGAMLDVGQVNPEDAEMEMEEAPAEEEAPSEEDAPAEEETDSEASLP